MLWNTSVTIHFIHNMRLKLGVNSLAEYLSVMIMMIIIITTTAENSFSTDFFILWIHNKYDYWLYKSIVKNWSLTILPMSD